MIKDFNKHIPKSNTSKTREEIDLIIDRIILKNREKLEFFYDFSDGKKRVFYVQENEEDKKEIKKKSEEKNEEQKESIDVFNKDGLQNKEEQEQDEGESKEEYKEILSDIKSEVKRIRTSDKFIEQEVDKILATSEYFIEKVAERVIKSLTKESCILKPEPDIENNKNVFNKESKNKDEQKEFADESEEKEENIKKTEEQTEKTPFKNKLKNKSDEKKPSSAISNDVFGTKDDANQNLQKTSVCPPNNKSSTSDSKVEDFPSDKEKKDTSDKVDISKPNIELRDINYKYDEKLIGKNLKEYLESKKIIKKRSDFEKDSNDVLNGNVNRSLKDEDGVSDLEKKASSAPIKPSDSDKALVNDKIKEGFSSDKREDRDPDSEKKDVFSSVNGLKSSFDKVNFSSDEDDEDSDDVFVGKTDVDHGLKEEVGGVSDLEKKASSAPIKPSRSDFKFEDFPSDSDKALVDDKIKEGFSSDKREDRDPDSEKKDVFSSVNGLKSSFDKVNFSSDEGDEDSDDVFDAKFDTNQDLEKEDIFVHVKPSKPNFKFEGFPSDSDKFLVDDKIKEGFDSDKRDDAVSDFKNKENLDLDKKDSSSHGKTYKSIFKFEKFFKGSSEKNKKVSNKDSNLKNKDSFQQVNNKKSAFKVNNLPVSSDQDKTLIENRIREDLNSKSENKNVQNIEKKAMDLASKHIDYQKEETKYNITGKNIAKTEPFESFSEKDKISKSEHEHVFFDEDVSFTGWSPDLKKTEDNLSSDANGELKKELDAKAYGEIGNVELPKGALSINSVKLSDLGFSENEWEELDFYSVHEPFVYVEILRERETLEKRYFLVEVELTDEEEEILQFINETIYSMDIETEELESQGETKYLSNQVNQVMKEYDIEISEESFQKITYYLARSSLGFGKIDPLMKDPNIEDISCDGSDVPVFLYHRKYGSLKSNVKFDSEDDLSSFVVRIAQKCGKHISIAEPMLDATMPDGSRVQMTLSDEITAHGSTFTIRKFRADPFSPPDLVEFNTMSSEMVAYMWIAIENGINMLFAGGTASGKTTALNALSLFIPAESKIVSIEETREINLPHPNWIPGVSRSGFGEAVADKTVGEIDMYDLMKAALRQRPEYILVGEIRGREAYVLFQAMATGHATYSTVHADSAQSLIHRLEGKPINIPRVMLQSLDVVSLHIITRVKNKRARRCKQLIEIIDIDPATKEILTNEVFRWDPVEDKFVYSGKSYILERIRAEKDLTRDEITKEIKNRMKIIEHMNENDIRDFREVTQIISKYRDNPAESLKLIGVDVKK